MPRSLLHPDQFIFPRPEPDFLCVGQALTPAGIWMNILERIMMMVPVRLFQMVCQLAVRQGICLQAQIRTGLIQRHCVKGGQHAQARQNRRVVLSMAVAVR